jgi:hypothetical protein
MTWLGITIELPGEPAAGHGLNLPAASCLGAA